ncbi:MAG TPA: hypothetical protein VJS69_03945 [Candidatus Krumholzibacteria bacterium]|nr:hypothetical protein [Candidatus Krumholzibacteria bacterium]
MIWTKKGSCASSVALALTGLMMFTGGCSRSHQSKVQDAKGNVQEQKQELAEEQRNEQQDVAKEQQDAQHDIAQKQEDVNKAEQHLNEVQHEGTVDWQNDWSHFRDDVNKKVVDNDKLIAEKRSDLANASTSMRDQFKKMIDDAEHRNHDLRDKVADYKYEGAASWDQFKSDTNSALDAVAASINKIDFKK